MAITDNFTDTDGTLLASHGGNWSNVRGSMVINNNRVNGNVLNDDCSVRWSAETPANDQWAKVFASVLTTSAYVGVAIHMSTGGGSDYYGYYASANNRYFFKFVTNTYFDLASPAGAGASAGDELYLEINGTTITAKLNGVVDGAFSVTDTSLTSGGVGVCSWTNNTGTAGDDFSGGALVSLVLEQEGFRFRNDDGSETTATWAASQDTNYSVSPSTLKRLRMLVNATGDPAAGEYKLQYRKVGDDTWMDVQ